MTAWTDIARILSILGVITIHASAGIVINPETPLQNWWVANFYDSISRWCVPVFVMVSGALLLQKEETPTLFFQKRIQRLLIPILFWTIFYTVWSVFKTFVKTHSISFYPSEWVFAFLTGQIYPHLWFVYMIIGLYAMTPALRNLVKHLPRPHLILLTFLGFFMAATQTFYDFFVTEDITHLFWITPLYYLPYFLAGYLIATASPPRKQAWPLALFLSASLATAGLVAWLERSYTIKTASYPYDYLSPTVIVASLSAMFLFMNINGIKERWAASTRRLAPYVFGIYLVHIIFMEIFSALGYNLTLVQHPVVLAAALPVFVGLVFAASLVTVTGVSKLKYIKRIV